jgi:hypothetical protein
MIAGMPRGRRADADLLVGEAHVQRIGVGGRVDRDGLQPELAAGADHPQRDLATVGYEDFLEHGWGTEEGGTVGARLRT